MARTGKDTVKANEPTGWLCVRKEFFEGFNTGIGEPYDETVLGAAMLVSSFAAGSRSSARPRGLS